MSTTTRLFSGPPVASIETCIEVYPAAILTMYHVITTTFPALHQVFSRRISCAFIVMVAGLCVLAKKPTATAIADKLGVVKHDALTRLLTHTCWNATLLRDALVKRVLLSTPGQVLPSYLILDDVILPTPFARWIAGIYWDWDHGEHRRGCGHRLVVVVWTNGVVVIPVAFALWHKQHSTYFLSATATFTTTEYTTLVTQYPDLRPLLASLVTQDGETNTTVRALSRLNTWPRALIGKKAWAIIAQHAPNQHRDRTKNEIARGLISRVVRKGLCGEYITFDRWYASKEHLNFLARLHMVYYAAIPCSRKINQASRIRLGNVVVDKPPRVGQLAATDTTRDYLPSPQGPLRALRFQVTLPKVKHHATLVMMKRPDWRQCLKRCLPDDHPIQKRKDSAPHVSLLTNAQDCSTYQVILRYRSRWAIEVMFRDLKQHLGLGACQHRNLEAITRHIALVMFAYVCLQQIRQNLPSSATADQCVMMTIGDVKKQLQSHVLISLAADH